MYQNKDRGISTPGFKAWVHLLQNGMIALPSLLFRHYHSLTLNEEQMMLLLHIHIFQSQEHIDFPTVRQIEERMSIDHHQIMIHLQSLIKSGMLAIDEQLANGIRSEAYNIEPLYEKLYTLLMNQEQKKTISNQSWLEHIQNHDVFTAFEQEFGRALSPLECESLT
ncbi:MAG: hypothetical protein WD907_01365, partial [Bacilli bacterium]